jgi:membrane protease YdiL (CAAX protease family)
MDHLISLSIIVLCFVALVVAGALGAFRARSIIGPDRLQSLDMSQHLVVTFAALAFWMIVPAAVLGPPGNTTATTQAATQPAYSAAQLATLGLVAPGAGLAAILAANVVVGRQRFALLGLTAAQFRRGVATGLVSAAIIIPITFAATLGTDWLWRRLGIEHPRTHELLDVFRGSGSAGVRTMILVSAIALAPLFEEIFFRGHVQTLFLALIDRLFRPHGVTIAPVLAVKMQALARWLAVVAASLAFAAVHAPWMIPPIFVLSIGMGYAYERSGNLWTPIVIHVAFNTINVLLFIRVVIGAN